MQYGFSKVFGVNRKVKLVFFVIHALKKTYHSRNAYKTTYFSAQKINKKNNDDIVHKKKIGCKKIQS
jgi:hypothetical protein